METVKKIFKILSLGASVVVLTVWSRVFGEKSEEGTSGIFDVKDADADVPAVAESASAESGGAESASAEGCGTGTACSAEGG